VSGITQFPIPEARLHWRSYLPEFLLRRLSSPPTLGAPESRNLEAVLLLSDIQGFSGLVQQAVVAGRGGLESLSAQLNAYFALLAEVVLDEGGDVLSVAGDAFLCLFEAEAGEQSLAGAARRAARAGLRIQQGLRDDGMPTRIGVAAGAVAVGQVGGHDERWDLVLGGPALEQVVAAERACPAGAVLVCSRSRELLAAGAVFAPALDNGLSRLVSAGDDTAPRRRAAAPDIDAERLRPYVPAIVLQRELLTDKAWMAEFRYVSVLLAQLPPLLPSDAQSLAQLHAGVGAFQRVISRYQGTMKVDADDKGLLLLGVFGLPMRSHEDNAGRAVRCALELVEALRTAGLPTAVAVTTGRAFCGVFGNHLRREYMLRGDVINLAARLSKSREDEVLCDRATVHGAREAAHFEAVGDVALRGVPQPVAVWRAVAPAGPAGAPVRPLALVGREAERAVLGQALDGVAAGRGGMALVSAEAGLGKSRLIGELRNQARERGITVLLGQAASIERSTPYFAWRPVVQRLLGLADDSPRAGWPARLRERLGDSAPLFGDLLDVAIEDNGHTAQLRGEVRAGNTRAAAMQLLQAAAREGPTLLVMEDLHWFDSSSLALLLELAQALEHAGLPLLLVATSRHSPDTQADAAWNELSQHCRTLDPDRVLDLPVLGEDDMRALMVQRLGVTELPPALEDFVLARVGGHPYFCEEFLLALRECGALHVEAGRCQVGALESMDLPTTVEGTLVSRIDGLTEPEQLCLKIGAVVGRRFAERTVTEAHPLESERTQVGERLRSLCRSELTQPEVAAEGAAEGAAEDSGAEHRFRFKHQITRDVAYDMMSSAQRRSLHAGVAQALESVHVLDASPPHAVLAYHWDCAGEPTRALHHLERAGEQALRGGAFVEAKAFFQRAVDSGERNAAAEPGRVAQWLKGLGTAQYFLGDMAGAQGNLERAVGAIDRPVPTSAAANTASLRELAVQALHALAPSRFHGRDAARQAVLDNAVDIYRTLGQIYYLDGDDMGRVTYVTLRGVNVGQRAGPSQALARVLANAGSMMGWLGLNRWSDAYLDAAVRMAGQGGQSGAEAYVWNITALTQAQRGAWVPALAANQRALELVRKIGDHNLEAEVWIVRATVHDCAGDYTALAADWPRARELALQRRNPQILCWSYLDECDALLGADDTAGAARALELALATPTALNDGSSVADKAQARAVVRLRQGRLGEALEAAREVLTLVTRQPPSGYHWVHFLAVATEVLIELSQAPGVSSASIADDAARGVRALEKLSGRFRNVLPRSRWLRGQLLQGAAARPRYAEALRLAEQNDMPFEQARALAALASLPDATPEDRRRAQAEALPCFARLGAVHEARRWAGSA
jgi:anti-anti-sigma factor